MTDSGDLVRNLRNLIELDRAFGVEFVLGPISSPRQPTPAAIGPAMAGKPRRETVPQSPARTPALSPAPAPPSPAPRPVTASRPAGTPPLAPKDPGQPIRPPPWVAPGDLTGLPSGIALARIASDIAACRSCGLREQCQRTVPGEGDAHAEIVFVGEGPGAEEDEQGRPFVGAAGQLLTRMIEAMGLGRDQVFICNVVKCRPPGNRTPEPDEVARCRGFLQAQLAAIRPRVICTLGNVPLRALMGDESPGITRVRGTRLDYQGTPLIPTFHPSYLLRNPSAKKPCWEDLRTVLGVLGRTPPTRS